MRPVKKPSFILNLIVFAVLVALTITCAYHDPLTTAWVWAAVSAAVLCVVWFVRWGIRVFLWVSAAMFGLDEDSQKRHGKG